MLSKVCFGIVILVSLQLQAANCNSILGLEKYLSELPARLQVGDDISAANIESWLQSQQGLSYFPDSSFAVESAIDNQAHGTFFALMHVLRVLERELRGKQPTSAQEQTQLALMQDQYAGKNSQALSFMEVSLRARVRSLQDELQKLDARNVRELREQLKFEQMKLRVVARVRQESRIRELLIGISQSLQLQAREHAQSEGLTKDSLVSMLASEVERAPLMEMRAKELADFCRRVGLSLSTYLFIHIKLQVNNAHLL